MLVSTLFALWHSRGLCRQSDALFNTLPEGSYSRVQHDTAAVVNAQMCV